MITAQQIKERLNGEKDPLGYIDGEISRCASQMSGRCGNIQDALSTYTRKAGDDGPIEITIIKDDLMKMGELYFEINTYLKVRKEDVKHQMRAEQVSKAKARREKYAGQNDKNER